MGSELNGYQKVVDSYFKRCKISYGLGFYGALMRDREDLFHDTKNSFRKEDCDIGKIISTLVVCDEHIFRFFERRARNRADMWFWLSEEEEKRLRTEIDNKLVLLFN